MNQFLTRRKTIAGAKYASPDAAKLPAEAAIVKVLITPSQLVFLVAHKETGEVMLLQPYQFSGINGSAEWMQYVAEIFESEPWLKKGAETRMGIFTSCSTLIPTLFDTSASREEILKLNCDVEDDHTIYSDTITNRNIHLVYALPDSLTKALNQVSNASIQHASTGLLSYLLSLKEANEDRMYVYVQPGSFQLYYIRERTLRFSNSFQYRSPEDFTYYFLFCCKQLKADAELIRVSLMGEVMSDSALFLLLSKYVRNIECSPPCNALKFGKDYPLPAHFFFNLFCL